MNKVIEMESEYGVIIDKIYKEMRPNHNMERKMGDTSEKITRKAESKKAGNFIADKIKKGVPVAGPIVEKEYKPQEIDWDKVKPRVKPSYIKKVEMKLVKKTKGKLSKASFD